MVAASKDADLPANLVLKKVCDEFGGKSGGRADFAQGGGVDPEKFNVERIYEIIEEILRNKHKGDK